MLTKKFSISLFTLILLIVSCAPVEEIATSTPIATATVEVESIPLKPSPSATTVTSTPEHNQTPVSDALGSPTVTETPIVPTETTTSTIVVPQETAENELPQPTARSTPINLSDVSPEWLFYDFPDVGISLSMPSDWEMLRYPGGYFFAPIDRLPVELTVGLKLNTPTELEAMTESLTNEWQDLTPFEFYSTPIVVAGFEGVAFWKLSPDSCVNVYVPVHSIVRDINFYSTFCNSMRDQLNEVGQRILDSIEIYAPAN